MGRKLVDISGKRVGNLIVVKPSENYYWECLCDCGNKCKVQTGRLKSGSTNSCGCLKIKHGLHGTPTYITWNAMLQRCNNINNDNYYKYGGVGVTVCSRWNPLNGGSFENFVEDMGIRPDGTSINRNNGATEYSKDNCSWVSATIQSYDQKVRKDNTTMVAGVRFRKDREAWEARISKENKTYLLYYGNNLFDAIAARISAENKLYTVL